MMNSKEIYHLSKFFLYHSYFFKLAFPIATTIICIIILIHYTSSQPLPVHSQDNNDNVDNSIWLKPSSDSESTDDSLSNLFLTHNGYNQIHPPNSLEPVHRLKSGKRANFWRKRANFWRRDITP